MTIKEVKEYLNSLNWVYAKSYSKTFPHFYINKNNAGDINKFEKLLKYIRDNSVLKTFNSKQYLYLEIDEFEYWEMGRPIKAVQILNKALINDNASYRFPIPDKNDELLLKSKLNTRDEYLELLLNKKNKTEKEIKIIDFLMDSQRRIHGGGKNIIDHSKIKISYE